jgi:hypothetical protein
VYAQSLSSLYLLKDMADNRNNWTKVADFSGRLPAILKYPLQGGLLTTLGVYNGVRGLARLASPAFGIASKVAAGTMHAVANNVSAIAPVAATAALDYFVPGAGTATKALVGVVSHMAGGVGEDMYRKAHDIPIASSEDKALRHATVQAMTQPKSEDLDAEGKPVGGVGNRTWQFDVNKHMDGLKSLGSSAATAFVEPWRHQAQTADKAGFPSAAHPSSSSSGAAYTPAAVNYPYIPMPSFQFGGGGMLPNFHQQAGLINKFKKPKNTNLHSNDASMRRIRFLGH